MGMPLGGKVGPDGSTGSTPIKSMLSSPCAKFVAGLERRKNTQICVYPSKFPRTPHLIHVFVQLFFLRLLPPQPNIVLACTLLI